MTKLTRTLDIIKYLLTGVALGAWSVTPLNGLFSVVKRALSTEIDIKYVLDLYVSGQQ